MRKLISTFMMVAALVVCSTAFCKERENERERELSLCDELAEVLFDCADFAKSSETSAFQSTLDGVITSAYTLAGSQKPTGPTTATTGEMNEILFDRLGSVSFRYFDRAVDLAAKDKTKALKMLKLSQSTVSLQLTQLNEAINKTKNKELLKLYKELLADITQFEQRIKKEIAKLSASSSKSSQSASNKASGKLMWIGLDSESKSVLADM